MISSPAPRRHFLKTLAAAAAAAPFANRALAATPKIKLGMDNFAVRAMNWKAPELLDYAASLKLDSILISDLDALGSLEDKHLAEIKAKAADVGVQIHAGTWSICPTSKVFKN